MAVTPEIQGLDSGVGLVPQGRLGSGIANVFDTNVATNLARLGARIENLDKLKLVTAAKLAAAKEKETVAKGLKSNPFEAIAASGKAAFNSGQIVIENLFNEGLNEYQTKKAAGDIEGANQVPPIMKYKQESVNNKTAAIDNDAEKFFTGGFGQFVKANSATEQNLGNNRPRKYEDYMSYNEMEERNKAYENDMSSYDLDKVGNWAMDASGKNTFQKTAAKGSMFGINGIAALFELPLNTDGTPVEGANLQVDYKVTKGLYESNPYIRRQMRHFGQSAQEEGKLTEEYKKATDAEKEEILKKYDALGEQQYMDKTLAGRGSKEIIRNLETNYHRAAAKAKGEGDAAKEYSSGMYNYSFKGRANVSQVANPAKKQGLMFDYTYGVVPNFNFKKNPQELNAGTEITPMGDPEVLMKLGIITKAVGGQDSYVLGRTLKFGTAAYVKKAYINQNIRQAKGLKVRHLLEKGMLLPTDEQPLKGDQEASGFIINVSTGPISNLSKADEDYLIGRGYTKQQIGQGINIPFFVKRGAGSAAAFESFLEQNFPKNLLPPPPLATGNL